jgi:hypothetical protein
MSEATTPTHRLTTSSSKSRPPFLVDGIDITICHADWIGACVVPRSSKTSAWWNAYHEGHDRKQHTDGNNNNNPPKEIACCNLCGDAISLTGGGTQSISRHLFSCNKNVSQVLNGVQLQNSADKKDDDKKRAQGGAFHTVRKKSKGSSEVDTTTPPPPPASEYDGLLKLIAVTEELVKAKDETIAKSEELVKAKDVIILKSEELVKAKDDIIDMKNEKIDTLQLELSKLRGQSTTS